ncbi:MAG: MarR family winged helix-turn-helix transcriptional regulator [Parvibaculaceae bacterium]
MSKKAHHISEFATSLLYVSRLWRRRADEAVRPHGLSEATALVLIHLSRLGNGVRQSTLAAQIGVEGASLVPQLDQLERAKILRREAATDDRRAKALHLTAKGRALVAKIEPKLAEIRASLLQDVSAAELDACFTVFEKIERRALTLMPEQD